MTVRKVGVEEELLLVDPDSSMLKPVSQRAIGLHRPGSSERDLEHELFLEQIESATEPCRASTNWPRHCEPHGVPRPQPRRSRARQGGGRYAGVA